MEEMLYPYIGVKEGVYVLFCCENYGTVIKSDNPEFELGMIDDFEENDFNFLSPETIVKIEK